METTKRPAIRHIGMVRKPPIIHNAVKIKSLLYLDMKQQLGAPEATAREIATVTGANCKSLYVLLERWDDWELVERNLMVTPFTYSIAAEGQRYLSKIGDWFFTGYYSRKRRRRIPGYRGNELKLRLELAEAASIVVCAYDLKLNELFYFKPPYHKAADFVREPIIDNKYKKWGPAYPIVVRYDKIYLAFNALMNMFGLEWCRAAGQVMVDAGLAYWTEAEKKQA